MSSRPRVVIIFLNKAVLGELDMQFRKGSAQSFMARALPLFALMMLAPTSAQAAERKLLVPSFSEIIVEGDIIVNFTDDAAPSAKAIGDIKQLDALRLDRVGKVLKIHLRSFAGSIPKAKQGAEPLTVNLTGRDVTRLVMRGAGRLSADILDASSISLELQGPGEIMVAQSKATQLDAFISGNGRITLGQGSADQGNIIINGAATMDAENFQFGEITLLQNGLANSSFQASRDVGITNNGAGIIKIAGKAVCFIRKAGSAAISCPQINKTGK